jgi:hypothetical protein
MGTLLIVVAALVAMALLVRWLNRRDVASHGAVDAVDATPTTSDSWLWHGTLSDRGDGGSWDPGDAGGPDSCEAGSANDGADSGGNGGDCGGDSGGD